jgi:hypothetical protein
MKDWDTPTEVQRSSRFRSFQEVRTAAESMLLEKFESLLPESLAWDKDAGLAYDVNSTKNFAFLTLNDYRRSSVKHNATSLSSHLTNARF